jgi:hypothetical protein
MVSLPIPRLPEPKRQILKALAWFIGGYIVVVGVPQLLLLTRFYNSPRAQPLKTRGEVAISGASLPQWLPLYPGAEAKDPIWRLKEAKVEGSVVLYTNAPPERVLDFYADWLPALGFAVEPRTKEAQVSHLLAQSPDGWQLTVQSGMGKDFTWIELDYSAKR